jgi:hypothetical protein
MQTLDNTELLNLIQLMHSTVPKEYPYFSVVEWLQYLTGARVEEASDASRWTLGTSPNCSLQQAKNGIIRTFNSPQIYEYVEQLYQVPIISSPKDYGRMWRYQLRRHLPRRYMRGNKEINTHLYRYNWVRNVATVAEGQAIFSNNLIWNTYYSAPITYK